MSEIDPAASTHVASPRRPATVIAGVALLAVSIGWWVVEIPRAAAGLAGPGGFDGFVLLSIALLSLPMLLEVVGAVLVWLGYGRGRGPLVVVALYLVVSLIGSGSLLVAVDLAIVIGAVVLLSRPSSLDWFRSRRPIRRGVRDGADAYPPDVG